MKILSSARFGFLFLNLVTSLLWVDLLLQADSALAAPACTPYTYDCSYCAATSARCDKNIVQDPDYPKTIRTLPIDFSYSKTDPNPPVVCASQTNTLTCHGGTVSFSASSLPITAPQGYEGCMFTPDNQIPTTVNCKYRTQTCVVWCSDYRTVTCTGCN